MGVICCVTQIGAVFVVAEGNHNDPGSQIDAPANAIGDARASGPKPAFLLSSSLSLKTRMEMMLASGAIPTTPDPASGRAAMMPAMAVPCPCGSPSPSGRSPSCTSEVLPSVNAGASCGRVPSTPESTMETSTPAPVNRSSPGNASIALSTGGGPGIRAMTPGLQSLSAAKAEGAAAGISGATTSIGPASAAPTTAAANTRVRCRHAV
ncbi:hypothetical protein G7066_13600 [Leucobacter coleopterorum]|uniref:Uncharacterized protein n=1 Tax=Leucobacter coleopterorum TaxID=2714933 RepID=A0ABX6JT63_9MICO|nr:hypothetical protein G7066_13600 [Leucobacter coleopterorum]